MPGSSGMESACDTGTGIGTGAVADGGGRGAARSGCPCAAGDNGAVVGGGGGGPRWLADLFSELGGGTAGSAIDSTGFKSVSSSASYPVTSDDDSSGSSSARLGSAGGGGGGAGIAGSNESVLLMFLACPIGIGGAANDGDANSNVDARDAALGEITTGGGGGGPRGLSGLNGPEPVVDGDMGTGGIMLLPATYDNRLAFVSRSVRARAGGE